MLELHAILHPTSRTHLAHVLMGSVVEHVVRKAPCSVLVVKTPRPG
jgi:nucleotide-binding universal stress UspA family protein